MPDTGKVLNGKYEFLGEIGHGGMAAVYLAVDRGTGRQWAVKELSQSTGGALAEAELARRLDHPMLPRVEEVMEDGDAVYIIMDYLAGKTLDAVVRERGPLPGELAVRIGIQLCDVLGYLHTLPSPVVCRDVKPANIMLLDEEPLSIRLFDLGIARTAGEQEDAGAPPLGTRGFAAPEQFKKDSPADVRTDIYGLGATLYTLVTGRVPPDGGQPSPAPQWTGMPPGKLGEVIRRCTAEAIEDRYGSCTEVRAELESCLASGVPGEAAAAAADAREQTTAELEQTAPLDGEARHLESPAEAARRRLMFCPEIKILISETEERV